MRLRADGIECTMMRWSNMRSTQKLLGYWIRFERGSLDVPVWTVILKASDPVLPEVQWCCDPIILFHCMLPILIGLIYCEDIQSQASMHA